MVRQLENHCVKEIIKLLPLILAFVSGAEVEISRVVGGIQATEAEIGSGKTHPKRRKRKKIEIPVDREIPTKIPVSTLIESDDYKTTD